MPSLKSYVDVDRRVALKLLASGTATLMASCSHPTEEIIPYANMPEGQVAGEPRRFATTFTLAGYGRGVLAISVDGRPIKVEGNPRHPFSLGATDVFSEAEVLALYDPERATAPRHREQIATWSDFIADWNANVAAHAGTRMGLVTGRIVSPTTLARIAALKQKFPTLRWYRYEPINDDAARAGARQAFGRVVAALPLLDQADVIVALDADPLGHGPDQLRAARGHAVRRHSTPRARIFVAEPVWTMTGAAADVRCAVQPGMIREIARAVGNHLGANLGEARLSDEGRAFANRVAAELSQARGRALVLAGEGQPSELHALCHWINEQLRAPVRYLVPVDPVASDHAAEIATLAADLHDRRLDALVIMDANPVYDAPDHLDLHDAIGGVPFSIRISLHADETAKACAWHLPLSHVLETWGDARALDGTPSLVQPLIQRLHDTMSGDEVLHLLATGQNVSGYGLTRDTWRPTAGADLDAWWRQALYDGVIAHSPEALTLAANAPGALPYAEAGPGLTLLLSPDPSLWDGRFANSGWLQECPKPFTKQVWGNAFLLAPGDAQRAGIADEDTITLTLMNEQVTLPAIIMSNQAEGVIATSLGHGRTSAGQIGTSVGARLVGLSRQPLARLAGPVRIAKSAIGLPFFSTQAHSRLNGAADALFQIGRLADLEREAAPEPSPPSLLPPPKEGEYAWAMVIDTDACIGCNACVVACQAENNVPIIGPREISYGRDMHWLRIDAYVQEDRGATRYGFQPVPCMHCELAPCEPVCPVEASVHDHRGLNVQVYNRCIGTRFCEANCPYKVRRFNWFAYAGSQAYADQQPALKAQHNPDVSARGRGVMEKCNYCLQRLNRVQRAAEKENRDINPGEMVTACQAACPTRAIHFGDLKRDISDVPGLKKSGRHYVLLEELNTKPRTTYLKRIYNDGDGNA